MFTLLLGAIASLSASAAQRTASDIVVTPGHRNPAGFGQGTIWNDKWQFYLCKEGDDTTATPAEGWKTVTLPHDWSVEATPSPTLFSCTGWLPGGIGWYRKTIDLPKIGKGERIYLFFEGVYNRSTVWLNGHELGTRPSGYASFCYEITPYLNKRENNELLVRVDHSRQADSRWYTGSGIWRDVWIVTAPTTHLAQWGTTYDYQAEEGMLRVNTSAVVQQDCSTESAILNAKATLSDAQGNIVAIAVAEAEKSEGQPAKTASGDKEVRFNLPLTLPTDVHLWDIDDPYLYTLTVELQESGHSTDATVFSVGLRTLHFSADKGFFLNGVNRKVKGVCLHHDAGVLGAAVPEEVWRWRLTQLKSLGCNAIRCSHNPQTPILYDLCDELGLLVMDEASDEWEFPKRKWLQGWNKGTPGYEGTADFFEEWIDRDVADMVRRDRRHPCIFLWSIGNEVDYPNDPYSHPILDGTTINQPMFGGYKPDAPQAERIGQIAKRLSAIVREHDATRPVTGALAGVVMSNQTAYPEAVDVVGYNYTEDRYAEDHTTYPTRIIYGSENGHGYEQWLAVRDSPYIFGQFIWTGTDYLGESGAWPSRGLGTGLLDFCGFPKMQGEMRRMMWSQQPGDTLDISAFGHNNRGNRSNHGNRQGGQNGFKPTSNGTQPRHPQAVSMTASLLNAQITQTNRTQLHPRTWLVLVELNDSTGERCEWATDTVVCTVSGPARLLGMETASNSDMSAPQAPQRAAYRGRLVAYVQEQPSKTGPIEVTFTAGELKTSLLISPMSGN